MFDAPGLPEPCGGHVDARDGARRARRSGTSRAGRPRGRAAPLDAGVHRAHSAAIGVGRTPCRNRAPSRLPLAVASCRVLTDRDRAGHPRRGSQPMPTYVYECAKCGDEFEVWQSFNDDPLKQHPGLRRQAREGDPAGRDRAQGLGLLQERQPQRRQAGQGLGDVQPKTSESTTSDPTSRVEVRLVERLVRIRVVRLDVRVGRRLVVGVVGLGQRLSRRRKKPQAAKTSSP